jgi:hypothetical protein
MQEALDNLQSKALTKEENINELEKLFKEGKILFPKRPKKIE